MQFDLVILGNLIVDDIVYEDGTTRMCQAGGATLYMSLAARLWGLRVGIVSLAGDAFPPEMLERMAERGIDLSGVRSMPGPGLRTWLLYEGRMRRVVHRLDGAGHAEASPAAGDIPANWQSRAFHLAPMPIDMQRTQSQALAARWGREVLLSLDPFELLVEEHLDAWRELLANIDVFFLSEDELPSAAASNEAKQLVRRLAVDRLGTICYKRGAAGGLAYDSTGGRFLSWQARAPAVRDTTGAGDAFAAGVLAGLVRDESLSRSLHRGVVAASFAVEAPGVAGLLEATPATADRRLREWFGS